MSEAPQVIRRWEQAGEWKEHPSPVPPAPAVPTLLVAVQVHNLFQADGHGIVPVDAGRGGMVRSTGCLLTSSWGRTHEARSPHPWSFSPGPICPQHLYSSLPRIYLPFFWSQYPNFLGNTLPLPPSMWRRLTPPTLYARIPGMAIRPRPGRSAHSTVPATVIGSGMAP